MTFYIRLAFTSGLALRIKGAAYFTNPNGRKQTTPCVSRRFESALGINCLRDRVLRRRVHPRPPNLLSHFRAKVVEFNKCKPDTARATVHIAKPSTTRFAFFDVLHRCGRNKSVTQAMVNEDESLESTTPARTAEARQNNDKFCDQVQSSAFGKNAKALPAVLEPLLAFLRNWDSPTARLPDVCPAFFTMDEAMRGIAATKQGGFVLERILSAAFDVMSKPVRARMYGPITYRVRVLYLQPIH
jgi:hypothetical protein